jgi:hypothetical protein
MHEVIQSLNQLATGPVQEDRVTQLFDALWPDLEKKIAAIPRASGLAKHTRPQSEILEELVASVRTLDSKFREVAEEGPRVLRHRSRRFHPMMIREMSHLIAEKPGDPVGFLVLSSLFREEMPWLYELGMEAYRASRDGAPSEAASARKRFLRAADLIRRGPFPMEEFGVDPRLMHMLIGEMDRFLDLDGGIETVVEASESSGQKSKRKKIDKLT